MNVFTGKHTTNKVAGRHCRAAYLWFPRVVLLLVFATGFLSYLVAGPPPFLVRGSVRQFFVIGARPGAAVDLRDSEGVIVQSGIADPLGGFIFRNVRPGDGYIAAVTIDGETTLSEPTTVLAEDYVPPQSFYDEQVLPTGIYDHAAYGYLTTRDGTKLSVQVQVPEGEGPFPTIVEYSGYSPSDPAPDQLFAGRAQPFRLIAAVLNYAYVGVNMRGTGCSGGAFDYFEWLQSLDGYDAIEVVAAQPWVLGGRIGMVGISYAGISQLFVAQTRPPHLTAISPLSVIDDTFRSTLYPGGIFNDGFALSWARERQEQNRWPDPVGADWVIEKIDAGDEQCAANQLLRQQNPDLLAKIQRNPYYPAPGNPDYPEGGDILSPFTFVRRINVPTYIAGAWQDDQTGGHWPVMLEQFAPDTDLRIHATNGTHADSLGPNILFGLTEFLDFHISRRVPSVPDDARILATLLYAAIFDAMGVQLPPDRFQDYTYEEARAMYDAEDRVHILWESGAKPGAMTDGSPEPAVVTTYAQWPPKQTQPARWYLQPDGILSQESPTVGDDEQRGLDSYEYDPTAKPRGDFHCPDGEKDPNRCREAIWKAGAVYDWRVLPKGKALSFISAPLPEQLTLLGSGSVDLWLKSTAPDTDIEVTLTEVRPDGQERYIQNGWLRASHRKLDDKLSTDLRPRHTHLEKDAEQLPGDQFVLVRVELFPFGHVFRIGSRLRINIEAPGGNRPLWTFDALKAGETTINSIGHSVGRPSRVVLPVVTKVTVPKDLPRCPTSLRSQPCRDYVEP